MPLLDDSAPEAAMKMRALSTEWADVRLANILLKRSAKVGVPTSEGMLKRGTRSVS